MGKLPMMIPETTMVGVSSVWFAVADEHDGDHDLSGDFSLES